MPMKIKTDDKPMELGFEVHQKGKFVFQVQQGVDFRKGSKDDPDGPGRALMLPLKSINVIIFN